MNDKFDNILSAKNEWESCVDSLEHQAMILLDDELKVIRANRTIELWGWADVKDVHGIHILNLITPAIEHDTNNDWIDEWCQLDTQSNVEWVSNNCKTGKSFRFSYSPNREIESFHSNDDCYALMLITDISNLKTLTPKENPLTSNNDNSTEEDFEKDYIRLSAYRLHQLANKLISTQEDERKRVSSELHDGLGQILSALKYQVELAIVESDESSQLRKNDLVLKDILKNVTFALKELRRVSADLRPSILEDLGILMTLKWFTTEYNKIYTELNVDLKLDILELDIPDKNKDIIYRIVQESMNNIAKHSDAKNIFIHLSKSETGILLRIQDDGSGFDLKKVKKRKKSGLGLKTMEERAINSGAQFTMDSSSLSGTVVQVLWEHD
jgi:signal transduction histidine kinase